MKILIIGGGNMGGAIVKALSEKDFFSEITICEKNKEKWSLLPNLKNMKIINELSPLNISQHQVIILAVKPQDLTGLLREISPWIKKQLIISIAAGFPLRKIINIIKTKKVVRVMPNLPAMIGEGISGWFAGKQVSKTDKKLAQKILSSFGEEIELKKESDLNIVTALSGSGPAYVFYFLQSLIEGAVRLGLPENIAKKLAFQTVIGSAIFAKNSSDDLKTLIAKIASKGGTTEQALKIFADKKLTGIIQEGIKMAGEKAEELSKI